MMTYGIPFKKYPWKKRQQQWEEDESTIESSQVNRELKNLFDFDDLCRVNSTPV